MVTSHNEVDLLHSKGAAEPLMHACDDDLQRRVKQCLADRRRELGRLQVHAVDGSVRLFGSVGSFYLRQLALSAVRCVDGVQHVIDDMDVPVPSPGTIKPKPR